MFNHTQFMRILNSFIFCSEEQAKENFTLPTLNQMMVWVTKKADERIKQLAKENGLKWPDIRKVSHEQVKSSAHLLKSDNTPPEIEIQALNDIFIYCTNKLIAKALIIFPDFLFVVTSLEEEKLRSLKNNFPFLNKYPHKENFPFH